MTEAPIDQQLADLVAQVGTHVVDEAAAFRAAFDDFVSEGSATTGEISLLVDAIATGALRRVREQVALGADPLVAIAVQSESLARDRGTSESSGAAWALSTLAHAVGLVPEDAISTRPAATGDARPAPAAVAPEPTPAAPVTVAAAVPRAGDDESPSARPAWVVPVAVVAAVVVIVAVAWLGTALLKSDGTDDPSGSASGTGRSAGSHGDQGQGDRQRVSDPSGDTVAAGADGTPSARDEGIADLTGFDVAAAPHHRLTVTWWVNDLSDPEVGAQFEASGDVPDADGGGYFGFQVRINHDDGFPQGTFGTAGYGDCSVPGSDIRVQTDFQRDFARISVPDHCFATDVLHFSYASSEAGPWDSPEQARDQTDAFDATIR